MPKKNSVYEQLLLPFLALFSPRFASGPNSIVDILATDVIPGDVGAGVCTKKINNTSSAVPVAYRDLNDHKLIIKQLITLLNLSVDIFSLHFFFPRAKLHVSPDICYLRMTDIESMDSVTIC